MQIVVIIMHRQIFTTLHTLRNIGSFRAMMDDVEGKVLCGKLEYFRIQEIKEKSLLLGH